MAKEWNSSKLVEAVTAAGTKGVTKSALEKKIPKAFRSKCTLILSELRSAGSIQGPFKKRFDYFFAPQFAPTRAQAEGLIEKLLHDAGLRLTTKTDLSTRASHFARGLMKQPRRPGDKRDQGFRANIWVRQFTPFAGGLRTPENWFVPQTTPRSAMIGLGSGVAAE